jgi:hypothetical protein
MFTACTTSRDSARRARDDRKGRERAWSNHAKQADGFRKRPYLTTLQIQQTNPIVAD